MSWHYYYVAGIEFAHKPDQKVNASDLAKELEQLIRQLRPLGQDVTKVTVTVEEGRSSSQ